MEVVIPIVFVALLAGLMIAWSLARAADIRQRWAEDNGYVIESATLRWLWRGPFWWRSSDNQLVFHITVRDEEGARRSGWLCCGSYFGGLFGSKASVRWDEE